MMVDKRNVSLFFLSCLPVATLKRRSSGFFVISISAFAISNIESFIQIASSRERPCIFTPSSKFVISAVGNQDTKCDIMIMVFSLFFLLRCSPNFFISF